MAVLSFGRPSRKTIGISGLRDVLDGFSIEVMPRTAEKIDDFRALLPEGTRVYIAHIDGTPIEDMVATAKRLAADGFEVMPHFPARIIADADELRDWVARYRGEAGVTQALVLGGGVKTPRGTFDSAIQLLETGVFQDAGFTRLHVAGHPEGNRDIDPQGGTANVDAALTWKQEYARATGVDMAIVTQFAFDAASVSTWARRLRVQGITLPIHLGVAGPAKLQTLIKFAIACGVGPSLKVLQKRAGDVTRLLLPFEPDELLAEVAEARDTDGRPLFEQIHLFPLGGIRASADFAARFRDEGAPDRASSRRGG